MTEQTDERSPVPGAPLDETRARAGAPVPGTRGGRTTGHRRRNDRRPTRRAERGGLFAFVLIAPSIVVLLGLVAYPIITVARQSLEEYNLLQPGTFVGLDNYTFLLTSDPFFWKVVRNTVVWTLSTVTLEMTLGLLIALALNQAVVGRGFFRGLVSMPWIVPPVTAGLIWGTLYNPRSGPINDWLQALGLPGLNWLSSSDTAMFSLVIVAVWKYTPLMVVGLLAALQAIPGEQYEAAAMDGASQLRTFFHVTLPALAPIMTILTILTVMWRWAQFDLVNIMTGGGPANSTQLISTYAYNRAIGRLEVGVASAMAILGVLLVIAVTGRFIRRIVREDLH